MYLQLVVIYEEVARNKGCVEKWSVGRKREIGRREIVM
jgi:hypothetical protein